MGPVGECTSFTSGNHDVEYRGTLGRVDRQPFRNFRFDLECARAGYPYAMEFDGVQLVAIDTTAAASGVEDLARGKVGYKQWVELSKYLEMGKPQFRVVMGHHHDFERDLGLELVDAAELRAVCAGRCDVKLMGHKHQRGIWRNVYGIKWVIASHKVTSLVELDDGEKCLAYRLITLSDDGAIDVEWVKVQWEGIVCRRVQTLRRTCEQK